MQSINDGVVGSQQKGTDGKDDVLVPLTSSLYVKGKLTDREKVLVDVGTGFYVEKVGAALFFFLGGWVRGWLRCCANLLISWTVDGKGNRVL